jgi:peptidoglycan/xylan/chitin deacetylase (PgdA/CDA1 family)
MPTELAFPDIPGRVKPLVLIDACNHSANFVDGGNAAVSAHTGAFKLAGRTSSVRVQNTSAGNVFGTRLNAPFSGSDFDRHMLAFYWNGNWESRVIRHDIGKAASGSALQGAFSPTVRHGWNFMAFQRHGFSTGVAAAWADSDLDRWLIRIAGSATPTDLYLSGLWRNGNHRPRILIHIDDVKKEGYFYLKDKAFDRYGWKATLFVSKTLTQTDTVNHMSLSEVQTAKGEGHVIANHSDGHATNMGLLSQAALLADLTANANWMRDNGLNTVRAGWDTALCYAAPFGSLSQSNNDALRANGYWFSRHTSADRNTLEGDAVNPWGVGVTIAPDATSNIPALLNAFWLAVAAGVPVRVLLHGVKDSGATASWINRSAAAQIVEAIRAAETLYGAVVCTELDLREELGAIPDWWS